MMAGSDTNNKSGLNTSHKRKNSQIMDRGKLEDDESKLLFLILNVLQDIHPKIYFY